MSDYAALLDAADRRLKDLSAYNFTAPGGEPRRRCG